jgi:hypothetical protein
MFLGRSGQALAEATGDATALRKNDVAALRAIFDWD